MPHLFIGYENFIECHPPLVSRIAAGITPLPLEEFHVFALKALAQFTPHIVIHGYLGAALSADFTHQALRDDGLERRGDHVGLQPKIE